LYNPGVPVEALKMWFAVEDERYAHGISFASAVDGGAYRRGVESVGLWG